QHPDTDAHPQLRVISSGPLRKSLVRWCGLVIATVRDLAHPADVADEAVLADGRGPSGVPSGEQLPQPEHEPVQVTVDGSRVGPEVRAIERAQRFLQRGVDARGGA